jgi:hypothetical protein
VGLEGGDLAQRELCKPGGVGVGGAEGEGGELDLQAVELGRCKSLGGG